jgi:hypothetical protein
VSKIVVRKFALRTVLAYRRITKQEHPVENFCGRIVFDAGRIWPLPITNGRYGQEKRAILLPPLWCWLMTISVMDLAYKKNNQILSPYT